MNDSAMTPGQVIDTLNGLIELNRDGQKGFQEAAEKMEAPEFKTFCLEQSRSRVHFVGELQTQVHGLGYEPENTGTVAAALHRGWLNLKAALGGGDHAILEATESAEDHAVDTYRTALTQALPADVREIIERQLESVKASHDKVKTLRHNVERK